MNKLLKYGGYLVAFIIVVFILLNVLDKMGVGCLFWCYDESHPDYTTHYYVDGKEVKKVQ